MFRPSTRPPGRKVFGNTFYNPYLIETYKNTEVLKSGNQKRYVVQATNHPKFELDLSPLAAAAETYHISPNESDYILIPMPIVTSSIPNRNGQGFTTEELGYFDPYAGSLVYQTFNWKGCHEDHDSEDPTKAKGVIVDSSIIYVPKYDVWKVCIVTLWDRTKYDHITKHLLNNKICGFSMGALVQAFICSICGHIDNPDDESKRCEHLGKGKKMSTWGADNRLSWQVCSGTTYFENSLVLDPADPTAWSGDIFV